MKIVMEFEVKYNIGDEVLYLSYDEVGVRLVKNACVKDIRLTNAFIKDKKFEAELTLYYVDNRWYEENQLLINNKNNYKIVSSIQRKIESLQDKRKILWDKHYEKVRLLNAKIGKLTEKIDNKIFDLK